MGCRVDFCISTHTRRFQTNPEVFNVSVVSHKTIWGGWKRPGRLSKNTGLVANLNQIRSTNHLTKPKPVDQEEFPSRKAFSAVLRSSFNKDIVSSSDSTDARGSYQAATVF